MVRRKRRKENNRQSNINRGRMHNPNNSAYMGQYEDPGFEMIKQASINNNNECMMPVAPQPTLGGHNISSPCGCSPTPLYTAPQPYMPVEMNDERINVNITMEKQISNIIVIRGDNGINPDNITEYPPIEIKINKIKKLVVDTSTYNNWIIKEIDADISSDDIVIDNKLKRLILNSLYYDATRSKLYSTLSSRQLKLLGGKKEEQIKILKEIFKNYGVDNIDIKDIVSIEPYNTENATKLSTYDEYKMKVNIGVGKKRILINLIVVISSPVIMLNVLDNDNKKAMPNEIYKIIVEKLSKQ